MSDFPVEDAVDQRLPVTPDDDEEALPTHADDVDPAEAYEQDRAVPVDEDEWR